MNSRANFIGAGAKVLALEQIFRIMSKTEGDGANFLKNKEGAPRSLPYTTYNDSIASFTGVDPPTT